MGEQTNIAWTDHTFNPWMGCVKVSAGCKHCYAETLITGRMGLNVWGGNAPRQVTKGPWVDVMKWDRKAEMDGVRRRVFCGSLCDVFEDHPDANAVRSKLWTLIALCKNLDWQLLTKRPENIVRMLPDDWDAGWPHVWLGTSIEDMRVAERADILRAIPAPVRFISYEPALGPLNDIDLSGIHWVIYGGESGPNRRPEDKQWARDMRDKCAAAGVAFFHKQSAGLHSGTGMLLDGKVIQEFPHASV